MLRLVASSGSILFHKIGVVPKWSKGGVCKTPIQRFNSARRLQKFALILQLSEIRPEAYEENYRAAARAASERIFECLRKGHQVIILFSPLQISRLSDSKSKRRGQFDHTTYVSARNIGGSALRRKNLTYKIGVIF